MPMLVASPAEVAAVGQSAVADEIRGKDVVDLLWPVI